MLQADREREKDRGEKKKINAPADYSHETRTRIGACGIANVHLE